MDDLLSMEETEEHSSIPKDENTAVDMSNVNAVWNVVEKQEV